MWQRLPVVLSRIPANIRKARHDDKREDTFIPDRRNRNVSYLLPFLQFAAKVETLRFILFAANSLTYHNKYETHF